MSSLKHRLFAAGFAATAALKADRWLRPLAQGCGAILMLHHVRPWRERAAPTIRNHATRGMTCRPFARCPSSCSAPR